MSYLICSGKLSAQFTIFVISAPFPPAIHLQPIEMTLGAFDSGHDNLKTGVRKLDRGQKVQIPRGKFFQSYVTSVLQSVVMHAFLLCHGGLSNAPVIEKNVSFVQLWFDCLLYAFRFLSDSEVTMFFFFNCQ